jgi:hypothetical protein
MKMYHLLKECEIIPSEGGEMLRFASRKGDVEKVREQCVCECVE